MTQSKNKKKQTLVSQTKIEYAKSPQNKTEFKKYNTLELARRV